MSKAVASRELIQNLKTINEDANTKHRFIYDTKEGLLASNEKARIIDWGVDGGNLLPEDKQAARRIDVWVKVPGRFGDLKGSYVNGSVFGSMLDLSSGEQFITSRTYSKLMQWWKGNKTKWSPSTHMTNTVSNVGMAYINDIPMSTVKLAASIISRNWSGGKLTPAEKQLLEMFNQSGAVLGNYSPNELHRKIAAALADDVNDKGDDPNSLWTTAKTMMRFEKIKATYNTISTGAGDLYQFEDNMFRFGAFIKELSVQQERNGTLEDRHILAAGAFAKAAMINYNIHAPLINALRQTVLPFLAWPYRAVPMLTRIAYQKPWKIAGMGSVVYAINALGYAATGANEDDERKKLPESMKQHVWGIGPSSYVRMPWGDSNTPTYLGLGKDIPNGDLIQQNDHGFMGIDDWPSFATPTGPWVSILMAGAGYDSYQGRRLYGDTDTTTQKAMASLKYLDNQLSPNVPGMNARLNQQIEDAYRGKKGLVGNDIDGMYTIMRDLGIGLSKLDRGELNAQQALQIKSLLRDYHTQISASMHAEARFGEPDYDSVMEDNKQRGKNLLDQIQKLTGEY